MKLSIPNTSNSLDEVPWVLGCESVPVSASRADMYVVKKDGREISINKYDFAHNHPGKVKHLLKWIEEAERLLTGPLADKFPLVRDKNQYWMELFTGEAREVYSNAVAAHQGNVTDVRNEDIAAGIEKVKNVIIPANGFQKQKRYLRRYLRKKKDMLAATTLAEIRVMNRLIKKFPSVERLKADGTKEVFQPTSIPDDEIAEIFEMALPNSWRKKFVEKGISAITHSEQEILAECEIQETIEAMSPRDTATDGREEKKKGAVTGRTSNDAQRGGKKRKAKQQDPDKECLLQARSRLLLLERHDQLHSQGCNT